MFSLVLQWLFYFLFAIEVWQVLFIDKEDLDEFCVQCTMFENGITEHYIGKWFSPEIVQSNVI